LGSGWLATHLFRRERLTRRPLRLTRRKAADAHERTVAENVLVHLQHRLANKPSRTPEEREFIVSMDSTRENASDEGRTEWAAEDLLTVLQVRGIAVPDVARERILAEKDPTQLERWRERAIVAVSIAEVLDEPS
jgi:hypothetical protein